MLSESSGFLSVTSFVEVNNFFNDLNVRFVDLFSLWDPLFVNFTGELFFGWGNLFRVVDDVTSDVSSEILVSLGGSSPVVGNLYSVFELKSSWSLSRCWGEFALSNLVLPGSGVHVLDVLTGDFPFSGFFLELSSGIFGVSHVFSKVLFDVPFQSKSLVDVIVNMASDKFSFFLLSIGDERFWLGISHGFHEFHGSSFVSLEFLWPFSFSGSFESSFISGNRFLVVNPIILEILVVLDISEFGIRIVLDDLVLVGNLEVDITRFVSDEFEVL